MIPSPLMFFSLFSLVNKRQEGKFVEIDAVIVLRTDFRSQDFSSDIQFEWVKSILHRSELLFRQPETKLMSDVVKKWKRNLGFRISRNAF